ncbi:MAG: T9SS type A sorting domain-containing protein [Chlorobi bacterium]|nr:T9SS type A sorting domain-containing protein [Chlorobiota bacterium]
MKNIYLLSQRFKWKVVSVLFFIFLFSTNAIAQTDEFDEQPGYQAWLTGPHTYDSNHHYTIKTKGHIDFNNSWRDDELDDVYYYVKDENGSWDQIFHGDCDNDLEWQCFSKDDNLITYSSDYRYLDYDDDGNEYDICYVFFKYENLPSEFNDYKYLNFRVRYDWDVDADQDNAGIDDTLYFEVANPRSKHYYTADDIKISAVGQDLEFDVLGQCLNIDRHDDELKVVKLYYLDDNGDSVHVYTGDYEYRSDEGGDVWKLWYNTDLADQRDYYTVSYDRKVSQKRGKFIFYSHKLHEKKTIDFIVNIRWYNDFDDEIRTHYFNFTVNNPGAYHSYNPDDISFDVGDNKIKIDILGYSYNTDYPRDELDDVKFYFTLPGDEEKYILHADCDYSNGFDYFTTSIAEEYRDLTEKDGDDVLVGDTNTGSLHGKFNYLLDNVTSDPEYVLVRTEYDWDLDSDQDNYGPDGNFYYKIRTGVYSEFLFDNNAEKIIVECDLDHLKAPDDPDVKFISFNDKIKKLRVLDVNNYEIGDAVSFDGSTATFNIISDYYNIDEENIYYLEFLDEQGNLLLRSEYKYTPKSNPLNLTVNNESGSNVLSWPIYDAYTDISISRSTDDNGWVNIDANITKRDENVYADNYNLQSCTKYLYRVDYKIDGKDYRSNEFMLVTPSQDDVQIAKFDASKLEYSDKIVLTWEREGEGIIDYYKIQREITGVENSLKTVFVSEDQNVNSFIDEQTQPGLLYKYTIAGYTSCDVAVEDSIDMLSGRTATWDGTTLTVNDTTYEYKNIDNVTFEGSSVTSPFTAGSDGTLVVTGVMEQESVTGPETASGIRQPLGVVSGQITFGQGSPVEGVKVVVEDPESDSKCIGMALKLTGNDSIVIPHYRSLDDLPLPIDNGYTIEAWIKLDNNGTDASLMSKGTWELTFNNTTGQLAFNSNTFDAGSSFDPYVYNHYAVNVSSGGVTLILNDSIFNEQAIADALNDTSDIIIGKGIEGVVDEVRLWDNTIDNDFIVDNYYRLLNGNEAGLVGYWRLDEGVSDLIIDMSQNNQTYEFNKNHGYHNALPVEADISSSKLGLCGITDKYGNYIINGIGFKGLGQSYIIVPMKGIHTFNPGNLPVYISGDNLSLDSKNFTDISSFPVSGVVKYKGYEYPVKDVSLLIDGNVAIGQDNNVVTTDENGEFTVYVPIGTHSLSIEKQGHVFENEYYTVQQSDGTYTSDIYFDHAIEGVEFYDTTKIKVAGRVVGGLTEAGKTIGFGLSKNNIGVANITLSATSDKYDISIEEGQQNTYTFSTDSVSGEFVQYLLPEKYIITDIKPQNSNNVFSFDPSDYGSVDLSNAWENDTIVYKYDSNDAVVDSFSYNVARSFIYRSNPTVMVTNAAGGSGLFEKELVVSDDTILLYDENGNYAFDHPVLKQNNYYSLKFLAYEKYENHDEGAECPTDSVPVTDGVVNITTSLAADHKEMQFSLNPETGSVDYTFEAGEPNLSVNAEDESLNFLQQISATFIINGKQYNWDGTYAYVLGYKTSGTNFVTAGQIYVDFILRDPPGDASYAYIEKGSSIEHSYTYTDEDGVSSETSLTAHLGGEVTLIVGAPATSSVIQTSNTMDITGGSVESYEWTDEDEYTTVTSFSQTISTSDDPAYVGSMADIYIGHSTNILYGICNSLSLEQVGSANFVDSISTVSQGYSLGVVKTFSVGEQFSTQFVYTQNHIENYLIPDIIGLRDDLLRNNPRYVSKLSADNPDYGMNNTDGIDSIYLKTSIEGLDSLAYYIDGNNYQYYPYTINLKDSIDKYEANGYTKEEVSYSLKNYWSLDSVRWCNNSIKKWKDILEDNERQKVNSTLGEFYIAPDDSITDLETEDDYTKLLDSTQKAVYENISFDAGASVESSVFIEQGHNQMHAGEFTFSPYLGLEIGYEFNKFGTTFTEQITYTNSEYEEENQNKIQNTTVGFVLADSDQGDYYTVDVKKDDAGNGPVFMVKGGQSSCPYQDVEQTQYYQPGTILNNATMAVEAPVISVVGNNTVTGVPNDMSAIFEVQLGNETQAGADNWYLLMVDPQSNRNGAVITVGGVNLSSELAVLIPANTTLTKVVEVTKPASADTTGDINLILHSMCQFDPSDNVPDISDTVTIRASFEPVCTNIELTAPDDKWIVNSEDNNKLDVVIGNFDNQLSTFERVDLQYRSVTSSQWITQYTWFKDNECETFKELEATGQLPSEYGFIDGASKLNYVFDFTGLNNGGYQIQAVSVCTDGSVNYSMTSGGIFDNNLPSVHGIPEPGDGILSTGDVISIKFDETINEGAILKDYNINVQGVLNDHPVDDAVSVQFDGDNSSIVTGEGLLLSHKPFTIEFKALFDDSFTGSVIGYGDSNRSVMTLVKTNDGFDIVLDGQTYSVSVQTDVPWNHYAIRFDGDETLALVVNGVMIQEFTVNIGDAFQNANMLTVGKTEEYKSFKGNIHNLRIWSYARTDGELYSNRDVALSGTEYGLMSYYPMDKGYGDTFEDKAGERHGSGYGTSWLITPGGKSFEFDGATALIMDCSSIPVTKAMDMTIELWFKADETANGTILFSNGTVSDQNLDEDNAKIINAHFTYDGKLEIVSNNLTLSTNMAVTDNVWHHMALVVNRRGNAVLYIDNNFNSLVRGDEFGSVEMSRMALGAGLEYVNDTETNYTGYYTGLIDEVRLWSVARPLKSLELYSHSKLTGDEFGLLAYYPFETVTEETVLNSLNNAVSGEESLVLENTGAENFSDLTAGIKGDNAVSNVGFTYTVNDDEIVIMPNSDQASLIENCVLEISVKDIQDMHGNKMASPVTWTAYVEQNTISWEDTEINITRGVNEEYTFEAMIHNSGGSYENYNITNLPSWLTAEPSTGVLNPDGSEKITFTIDRGLNIGQYSEEIYLSGNMAFNEKLLLNVSVKGEEPDWEISGNYDSEMNMVATLTISGETSQDKNDIVGAFVNEECRGVSHVSYISETGEYMVLMTIYGDKPDENIIFKVFDASTGLVYSDVSPEIKFADSKIEGSFSNPVNLECGSSIQQAVNLNEGWTWISFNSDMSGYTDVNELLKNINAVDGDRLVYDNADPAQFATYSGTEWVSNIEGFNSGQLYRINIVNGGTLLYEGIPIDPESFELEVSNGWNRIGYIPQVNMTVDEALSGYDATVDDVIKGRHGFAIYNGYSWLGNLEFLEPNHGYMLKRQGAETTSFKYPSVTALKNGTLNNSVVAQEYVNTNIYEYAFSVLAELKGIDMQPGDIVLAYINNDVRGAAVQGDDKLLYVSVYGTGADLGDYITFRLKRDDELIELNGGCSFNGNSIEGTLTNPVLITADQSFGKVKELNVYPNPFDKTLNLQVLLSEETTVSYSIVSIAGEIMYNSPEITCYSGINKLPVEVSFLTTGVYYIRVKAGDEFEVFKVVKK